MSMFDEAGALSEMIKMTGLTQSEMAKRLGVSQSYVANKLRLLSYGDDERAIIISGGLTERHARAILRLDEQEARKTALERTLKNSLTVAECEALVDFMHADEMPKKIESVPKAKRIHRFRELLTDSILSLKSLGVNITDRTSYYGKKTYITICIEEDNATVCK